MKACNENERNKQTRKNDTDVKCFNGKKSVYKMAELLAKDEWFL